MTNNNEIEYTLGIQIRRERANKILTLSQDKYIQNILTKFNMALCNPITTPLKAGLRYTHQQSEDLLLEDQLLMSQVPYKQAIGSLQYLCTLTRWDIAFPINYLAQFMIKPAPVHWLKVKHILRYLCGTICQGLTYHGHNFSPTNSHFLRGWNNANWASDVDTRCYTSGYIFQLISSCVISWQSYKQSIVALSSTKAKYIAVATATKELIWLQAII